MRTTKRMTTDMQAKRSAVSKKSTTLKSHRLGRKLRVMSRLGAQDNFLRTRFRQEHRIITLRKYLRPSGL